MKTKHIILLCLLFSSLLSPAKTPTFKEQMKENPEKASGLYRLYPSENIPDQTPAPYGYRPFYLSHYGRHGSRWLSSNKEYDAVLNPLIKADSLGVLTPKGKEVYQKTKAAKDQAAGVVGCLSPLGRKQHQGIAERMHHNYPDIFATNADIDARATITGRCVMSMQAFCERLKELNPDLNIGYESSIRTTGPLEFFSQEANDISPEYINFCNNGEYLDIAAEILDSKMKYKDFLASIFSENIFDSEKDAIKFLYHLFYLAGDLQSVMPEASLWEIYTPEQLYWMAVTENFRCHAKRGPYPEGVKWNLEYAKRLLNDIVDRCDAAVAGTGNDADLRFGHDLDLMALYPLMCLNGYQNTSENPKEIFEKWNLYDMTPMAANLQIIFYRPVNNPDWEPLVKFLINEREAEIDIPTSQFPYYKWSDVRKHLAGRLNHKF